MKTVCEIIVGSKLYGLANENSDTDKKGIFFNDINDIVPTEDNYFGIKKLDTKERLESNTGEGKDKVECTLYSARYFVQLYLKGNPTLAEMPFADKKFWMVDDYFGERIMSFIRDNMITQHLFNGYYGYYNDQIKCFVEKGGKYREKRKELVEKYGYDGKMASHAYRIGVQGVELFSQGKITPTMSGDELSTALALKNCEVSGREEVINLVRDLGEKMKLAKENCSLPLEPDIELVNKFCVDIHKEFYYGSKN